MGRGTRRGWGIALAAIAGIAAGCGSSKVSQAVQTPPPHIVQTVAMAPSGGTLADAVAAELMHHGYVVLNTTETGDLLVRLEMTEADVPRPESLTKLRSNGVDAYLMARASAGADGLPQQAIVRVNSTHTGVLLAAIAWQNGWGGISGSRVDHMMRSDLAEAASEIAEELADRLRVE